MVDSKLTSAVSTYSMSVTTSYNVAIICSYMCVQLADAGFYHIPSDQSPDATRCFACYKELDGWEPDDDPR